MLCSDVDIFSETLMILSSIFIFLIFHTMRYTQKHLYQNLGFHICTLLEILPYQARLD